MGCGDDCPLIKAETRQDWQIQDPKNMPADEFRVVRDEIEGKVKAVLSNMLDPSS